MSRWCYFSNHFTLGLKGSAAVVTLARVAWHILKWPFALSLGILTISFTSLSRFNSLCCFLYTTHLLNSSLCLPCSYLWCPFLSLAFLSLLISCLCLSPTAHPYPISSCHLPFSASFSPRTPMFSLGPDNNCK